MVIGVSLIVPYQRIWCWNGNIPGELDRCRCCWCHSCLRHQVMVGHDISFLRSARHCLSGEGIWTFCAFLLLRNDQNCKRLLDFPKKCRTRRVNPNPTVILLFNCMILRLTRCEWRHMVTEMRLKIGSDNRLLPHDKPLPEPMLTNLKWSIVIFTGEWFNYECLRY